jgi:hypothetical protein
MQGLKHISQDAHYDYASPIALNRDLEPFFRDLIGAPAVQRLKGVRFLGGIDYLLVPSPNGSQSNARYTRFQHSLGVARLALHYSDLKGLDERRRRLVFACALLHDIGHAPLSHSLEPVFQEAFGVDHHQAGAEVITGATPLGREILGTLRAYGVDPDQVLAIIEGEDDPFDGFFAGPINLDTIEAILRARRYLRLSTAYAHPTDVVRAAVLRESLEDQRLVDTFWSWKHHVYKFVIRSRHGVLSDRLCQQVARDHLAQLSKKDFFSTESALFRKLPALRAALRIWRSAFRMEAEPVSYEARSFFIDSAADFFARDDRMRYRQSKAVRTLISP